MIKQSQTIPSQDEDCESFDDAFSYTIYYGPVCDSKPTTRQALIASTSLSHVIAAEEWASTYGQADVRSFNTEHRDWFVMVKPQSQTISAGKTEEKAKNILPGHGEQE